ncbi:CorA metal ion transporter [Xylographa trunciseda]|nr:CorA metal ion transporter [Xylographa trunciseda]
MDISDILTSVSAHPPPPAQSPDLQALTRAWVNERVAPEVLPWPEELMARVLRGVAKLVERVEEQTATMDPKTNFRVVIMQTELERWKFLVRSFLRARIAKIDKHILHYLTAAQRTRLSASEIQYATTHQNLLHEHYHSSFLAQFPVGLQKLDDTAGGIAMVEVPDAEKAVFVRGLRPDPVRVTVEGTDMDFQVGRGEVVVVRWSAVKNAVEDGELEFPPLSPNNGDIENINQISARLRSERLARLVCNIQVPGVGQKILVSHLVIPEPSSMDAQTSSAKPGSGPPERPTDALQNTQSTSNAVPTASGEVNAFKKKRNHRGGKKKKNRRQSFAAPSDNPGLGDGARSSHDLLDPPASSAQRPSFYRLGQSGAGNLSDTSLDSSALLDHRDHPPMRTRRDSRLSQNAFNHRGASGRDDIGSPYRPIYSNPFVSNDGQHRRSRTTRAHRSSGGESEEDDVTSARTPLLPPSSRGGISSGQGYGASGAQSKENRPTGGGRRISVASSASSKRIRRGPTREPSATAQPDYDVNNPPSVPGSPMLGSDMGYDDVMVTGSFASRSPQDRRATTTGLRDQIIDVDGDAGKQHPFGNSTPPTPRRSSADLQRRRTVAIPAEEDVCFPLEGMSELADEDYIHNGQPPSYENGPRRRRPREWPDISVLEEWSREEKEVRSEGIRAKKVSEPVLIGGRLRPQARGWHREVEDAPYRFTYFNEEFQSTIHSQTISELVQPGQCFRDLFIPDPPELSDESSDEEDLISYQETAPSRKDLSPGGHSIRGGQSRSHTRQSSVLGDGKDTKDSKNHSHNGSGQATPANSHNQNPKEKQKRYGSRPTFWLDVLSPTDTEMRVISKTFGIHPLTAEDIMMQEAREKVELFRNYYFVNYRTFEQDTSSEDYLEPINMYIVVFREGVITFHFSMTPHPANVRRRIRQLKDYLILSSDWISYAVIDDITDVFAPLIQSVEEEVDDIDDSILQLHNDGRPDKSNPRPSINSKDDEKRSETGEATTGDKGGDMLRRVGEARKKVMGLYRLLGNKADVIKGFAKRCNEQWEIAPKSEIGLYLGDIQDHILTMTSNLSHYETLLSRAHSNYLAQINIRMNERQEQTADVLGKLTVLGTIVLPMNIVTGMWGMNVLVPGQDVHSLTWFWCITAGLFAFGFSCYFIAKRVYGIV